MRNQWKIYEKMTWNDPEIGPLRPIFNTPLQVTQIDMLIKTDAKFVETFWENDQRLEFWPILGPKVAQKSGPLRPIFSTPIKVLANSNTDVKPVKISGHFLNGFSSKCLATPNLPVSLGQNSTKVRKINRTWSWYNQFWRWSGYISMRNFRPFLSCVLQEMPGNPGFDLFHYVKIATKLEKLTGHDHNLVSSEGGQDTSVSKISGHSLHVFSRKCPETQNLTRFTKSK